MKWANPITYTTSASNQNFGIVMSILVWCIFDYKTIFFCSEAASSLLPLVFQRERDYSIVSISMSQYPITSLEWGSCRELVLLLFLARILRNNRCICMAKCKWTNEAFVLHWTMKTLCTLNCKKTLSQYGLAISQTRTCLNNIKTRTQ